MTIIGVTGGMGSGKTLVSSVLGTLGAKVIEADKVAKRLYAAEPDLKRDIIEAFGMGILDEFGEVSFKRLAAEAFKDESSTATLNKITHPYIREAIRRLIIDHSMTENIIAVDAALLFEGELLNTVDYIIAVTAPEDGRIDRIVSSGRFTEDEVRRRMKYQLPDEEKAALSDFVIVNTGTIEDLERKVKDVFNQIKNPPDL